MLREKASFVVRCHKIIKITLTIKISHLSYAVARETRKRYTVTSDTHKHHRNKVVKVEIVKGQQKKREERTKRENLKRNNTKNAAVLFLERSTTLRERRDAAFFSETKTVYEFGLDKAKAKVETSLSSHLRRTKTARIVRRLFQSEERT